MYALFFPVSCFFNDVQMHSEATLKMYMLTCSCDSSDCINRLFFCLFLEAHLVLGTLQMLHEVLKVLLSSSFACLFFLFPVLLSLSCYGFVLSIQMLYMSLIELNFDIQEAVIIYRKCFIEQL